MESHHRRPSRSTKPSGTLGSDASHLRWMPTTISPISFGYHGLYKHLSDKMLFFVAGDHGRRTVPLRMLPLRFIATTTRMRIPMRIFPCSYEYDELNYIIKPDLTFTVSSSTCFGRELPAGRFNFLWL